MATLFDSYEEGLAGDGQNTIGQGLQKRILHLSFHSIEEGEEKKKALTLLLRPDVSTNNHLKSVNNPPCWGENYFKDLLGAKEACTNTGALSRWGEFEKGSAGGSDSEAFGANKRQ